MVVVVDADAVMVVVAVGMTVQIFGEKWKVDDEFQVVQME